MGAVKQGLSVTKREQAKEAVREAIIGGQSVFTLDRLIARNEEQIAKLVRENDGMIYHMLAKGA